jgi:hypothetical protein
LPRSSSGASPRKCARFWEDLLTQEPLVGDTVPGKTSAYKLTLMKKLSQSTKPSKVKERVVDLSLVRGLYDQLRQH